jgi:nucleotide-binding universal stress UspA family protein
MFPWARNARVHAVVARQDAGAGAPRKRSGVTNQSDERIVARTRRALARRWPDAEVTLVDKPPAEAILNAARRLEAAAICIGWRGHGGFRRLLMGSVSREVVRHAACPVLVVRQRPRHVRAFLVGVDGSLNARRAVTFLSRLHPPPTGGGVTVVRVEEPAGLMSAGLLPGNIPGRLRREVAALSAERLAKAERDVEKAASQLRRAGWRVRTSVRSGAPLNELLATVAVTRAHVLVVGARGVRGLSRVLLGSVAEGSLNHSPVPVLVAK